MKNNSLLVVIGPFGPVVLILLKQKLGEAEINTIAKEIRAEYAEALKAETSSVRVTEIAKNVCARHPYSETKSITEISDDEGIAL
jgi:hypothetical protein